MKKDNQELLAENEELRIRLEEAEEMLSAIRSGEVDALVVSSGEGDKVFTLEGADQSYRVLVETMSEGAATLNPDSSVLFCNSRLAQMLGTPLERVLGKPLLSHVAPADTSVLTDLLERSLSEPCRLGAIFRAELTLLTEKGNSVPALLSCCALNLEENRGISVIVTDLSEQKRNEAIVAEGELASSILEQAGEAIIVCDESGRVIRASRQVRELFGTNPNSRFFDELGRLEIESTGKPFSISAALDGQIFKALEVKLLRHNRQFHLILNAKLLLRKMKILGCVVTLTDITELKRSEEELQSSKDRLTTALEIAQLGIWEYDGAADVIHFDERSQEVFGLPDARPRSREEIFSLLHPDDRPQVEDLANRALDPHGSGRYETKYRIVRYDGSLKWISARGQAIRSRKVAGGKPPHFVGTLMDITERKQVQDALRESEKRYRTLFDSIDEGFCVVQMLFDHGNTPVDYRFLEVNPAFEQHTGLTHAVGRTTRELIPHIEEFWFEVYGQVALTGEAVRFENYATAMNRWFDVFAFRIGDPEERKVAILFRDVTERKVTDEALKETKKAAEEASRAKSEFLANMSHEIRTPMTIFVSAIEQLLQLDENPEGRQLLEMADRSARRLRRLIDDILDVSRIEARQFELGEEPFDLSACVRDAVEIFSHLAREKDLRLAVEIAPETPYIVVGDPDRLGQVLINLVGNAVKFTDQGEIRVSVRPRGDYLEIVVADTGLGIPKKKRELIFQKFQQVDSSFTRKFGGSGLGLSLSKGLVELMGGELSVQSTEGEGSVFSFTVCLKTAEKQSPDPVPAAPEDSETEKPVAHILLAEDDPMIRKMFTMMLTKQGWQVETANTGTEAVEKSAEGAFDIILMDLQMPEMSGIEATRVIRKRELQEGKRTYIIGLTAHADQKVHEKCLASGMDKVLTKPIQLKDLIRALNESCS